MDESSPSHNTDDELLGAAGCCDRRGSEQGASNVDLVKSEPEDWAYGCQAQISPSDSRLPNHRFGQVNKTLGRSPTKVFRRHVSSIGSPSVIE